MPPTDLTWQSFFTAGVVAALLATLISRRIGADIAFLCGLASLLVAGIITPREAVAGFANPAVITIGLLYIVAQGLKETGGMTTITRRLIGRPRSPLTARCRLLVPVAALSAFVNNTPIVAMFLPVLSGWARRNRLNTSQLLMPLSFAAMLGGICTLIGTSTNLVVSELLVEHGLEGLGMFTLARIGVPVTIVGLLFVIFASTYLLPTREDGTPIDEDPRSYTVWMRVDPSSPIVGQTIEEAGLRHLRGLFLAQIEREDEQLIAVGPDHVLRANDRLQFVGVVDSVVELQQIQGLTPDTEQLGKLHSPRHQRRLIEAVVSESSPLVGKSVRAGRFRTAHNAVIIAVHRAGERIRKKIGDIVLRPGDTLLLEAPPEFAIQHRNSSAFYLVSERPEQPSPRWGLAWVAILLLAALVTMISAGMDTMTAALCVAMAMVITRCCTGTQARQSVDWQVLIVIGAAFGLAAAIEKTGVATFVAGSVVGWSSALGQGS
ncbi:MAG: SLC13 family permease, partial [Planctomycetota bacterium]